MDKSEVNDIVKGFLLSGTPIAKTDENSDLANDVIDSIRLIFDAHMPEIRAAAKEYMKTEDLDALVLSLLPVHNKIWYEAYAPYWLSHCKPVDDRDTEAEFTYYNDLIDMYWVGKWQEWKRKGEFAVTIMLPPTKGLLALAYQEEIESLEEYYKNHGRNDRSESCERNASGVFCPEADLLKGEENG